jgi:hypothetical protein
MDFFPSPQFNGYMKGYFFTTGVYGTGYYFDKKNADYTNYFQENAKKRKIN